MPVAGMPFVDLYAADIKRCRRQLERRWLRTGDEKDRVAYRRACRSANSSINEARRSYFRDQLNKATDSTERWRTVKTLLHSHQNNNILSDAESDSLCKSCSQFFIDKISDLKQAVARDPNSISSPSPELLHPGPKLENLTNTVPPKSLRLDYFPTLLIKSCSSLFADLLSGLANLFLHRVASLLNSSFLLLNLSSNSRVRASTLPQITGQYQTLTTHQKYLNGSSSVASTHTLSFLPTLTSFSQLIERCTLVMQLCVRR